MLRNILFISAMAALFRLVEATNSNKQTTKSFQVCMVNPAGLGDDVVKTAAVPLYDCSDKVKPLCV